MPDRVQTIVVEQSRPLERLDSWLRGEFPGVSRGTIQRLLEEGRILVDGRVTKPTHRPHAGEVISVTWPEAVPSAAMPEDIPLEILFEDDDMLALNKPPGIVVHPAAGHAGHTLVNALLHHCAGKLSGIGGVARPGIVHRLDKDTSGCLIVAKNDFAHTGLAAQFAGRDVEKIYHALVCGELSRDEGEIRGNIARHPVHRKRMAVVKSGGREARTGFKVLERFSEATLVEARLHTGRTHQIRVHLREIGFPVVGDATYGQRANARLKETRNYSAPRQMLHARSIALLHPRTKKRMFFEAPIPNDFAVALEFFRLLD